MNETVLEIHLSNLRHNYQFLRKRLNPETKLLAVVKAFGYGSDAVAVASCLAQEGVDYFGVAYVREGVQLREAGITTPILVLHPQVENLSELIAHHLEPSVYGYRIFEALVGELKNKNVESYPIHLKFNTGLNRLGFKPNQAEILLNLIEEDSKHLHVHGIYSHLAASDDLDENEFTQSQLQQFSNIVKSVKQRHPTVIPHVLNTSGVLHYPQAQYDMVRTGISLYGFGNDPAVDAQLKPILTLKTVISQIHLLERGETLGYKALL